MSQPHSPATPQQRQQLSTQTHAQVQLIQAPSNSEGLFHGQLSWLRLRDGLSLHCSSCTELSDFITRTEIRPCLNLVLFLQGNSAVHYGERRIEFGPRRRNDGRLHNEAVAIALAEPDQFYRQARRGAHIRKIAISLEPQWFEAGGLDGLDNYQQVQTFAAEHLRLQRWQPSARLFGLAEQILGMPGYGGLLQRLQVESHSLEMASEALQHLSQQHQPSQRPLGARARQRLARVIELLQSPLGEDWGLDTLAREVGLNTTSLQQQFKREYGLTIFDYLRRQRLFQARQHLAEGQLGIAEIAWQAGYSSAANFATAFKRQFGMTPRQARGRR
jgi:AraC-like DNA-binding protein